MNQQTFNKFIEKFLQNPSLGNKQNISKFHFNNLESLVKNAGGLYLKKEDLSKNGHPQKINNKELFYVVEDYNMVR